MAELVCPTCKSGYRLYSTETVTIDYPVRLDSDPTQGEVEEDGVGVTYTGEDSRVDDGSATFEGVIWCRNCSESMGLAALIPAPEPDGE
jgi:uncharacterized protein YbaR (Trm112 family)